MSPTIAVIDIGSNSIKILVAQRGDDRLLVALKSHTIETRISSGIGQSPPRLSEQGMVAAISAVQALLVEAVLYTPVETILVATSAVRDSVNGKEFCQRVAAVTGFNIRILSGDEEANLIGRGLLEDPALGQLEDFYVFDLGGGSLEGLTFRHRRVAEAVSLPLGCVRLTERFVTDSSGPFLDSARQSIDQFTRITLAESGYAFSLGASPAAVFTGGTVTTARAILATQRGQTLLETPSLLNVSEIRRLLDSIAPVDLERRKTIPGLPPARADIFPAALATILGVASSAGIEAFHHSLYNLRWGLAAEAMERTGGST